MKTITFILTSHKSITIISFGTTLLFLLLSVQINTAIATTETETQTDPLVYMVSTRENQNHIGIEGPGYGNYSISNINQLFTTCPDETTIFVHGWGLDENEAKERLDRVKMSLENNNYSSTLVGFSWDSKKLWNKAKDTSNSSGPLLADFIFKLTDTCMQNNNEVKIRLIGHSLGSRLILSSLDSLNKNNTWNNNNYTIASVHLMAAAVDNEEVSKDKTDMDIDASNWETVKTTAYGGAIEQEVIEFYNLYSPEDNALEPNPIYPFYPFQINPSFEGDWTLGYSGYQTVPYDIIFSLPSNYKQINVQNELIPMCDADGNNEPDMTFWEGRIVGLGDNHGGYMGFRDTLDKSKLIDDGAMNVVVDNWNNVKSKINQSIELTSICR